MPNENERLVLLVSGHVANLKSLLVHLNAACFATRTAGSIATTWQAVVEYAPFAIVIDATDSQVMWAWDLCQELAEAIQSLVVMLVPPDTLRVHDRAVAAGADYSLALSNGYAAHLAGYLDRQAMRMRPTAAREPVDQESKLDIDLVNRRVYRNGSAISLSRKECAVLGLLLSRPDQAMPLAEICVTLWSTKEYRCGLGLLKQYVGRLRRKIEPDPDRPIHLETVRTVGYCFHPKGRIRLTRDPAASPPRDVTLCDTDATC